MQGGTTETRRVALRFADARIAILREPTGADELAIDDIGTAAAIALIDRSLVSQGPGTLTPGHAARLAAADRDQVLVRLHDLCFGDRIANSLHCPACARPFDFSFSLSALAAHVHDAAEPAPSLRLPSGADELEVAALDPAEAETALARRCLGDDADTAAIACFGDRLARAAPIISLDLDAPCPECGCVLKAPFDLQGFFLARLRAARASLLREVHKLASHYHWSAAEILALPRGVRRSFVALIDADRAPRRTPARLLA
jgi:hypothetical protein